MIELAEVIGQLREELDRARSMAGDAELQFELGPIELEVTVGLEQKGGAGAKIRFWVVELGGDAGVVRSSTQRIKLVLKPALRGPDGSEQHRTAYVKGDAVPGEE